MSGGDANGRSRFDFSLEQLTDPAASAHPDDVCQSTLHALRKSVNGVAHADGNKTAALARDLPRLLDLMRRIVERAPRAGQ